MTADLLRRATAKLREAATAATPGPWRVEQSENWDDTTTYSVLGVTDDRGVTPVPFRTTTEDAGYHSQAEADVNIAALMHPPVALALAELLDGTADDMGIEIDEQGNCTRCGLRVNLGREDECACWHQAFDVARAVLREEES